MEREKKQKQREKKRKKEKKTKALLKIPSFAQKTENGGWRGTHEVKYNTFPTSVKQGESETKLPANKRTNAFQEL